MWKGREPNLQNVEGASAAGIEEFYDRDRIRDVLLRLEGREDRFDVLGDEFHFLPPFGREFDLFMTRDRGTT